MKKVILLLGASGQVGRAVESQLFKRLEHVNKDFELIKASHRTLQGFVELDYYNMQSKKQWMTFFESLASEGKEITTVVNCIGIWKGTDLEFEVLQHIVPTLLMDACAEKNIHLIHVGALGFDDRYGAELLYMTTKVRAHDYFDKVLSDKKTLILPSLIFGPDGNNANFFAAISALPIHADFGFEENMQPVHEDDVGKAIVEQIFKDKPDYAVECAGTHPISPTEYFKKLRTALGLGSPWLTLKIPKWIGKTMFYTGGLLFKSHFVNKQTWLILETGSKSKEMYPDSIPYKKFSGSGMLERLKEVQLYWAMRLSVAFVWIATSFSILKPGAQEQVMALMGRVHSSLATPDVANLSNFFDFLMGITALVLGGKRLWKFQLAVTIPYVLGLTVLLPLSLIDPINSLSKNLTLLCAIAYLALTDKKR